MNTNINILDTVDKQNTFDESSVQNQTFDKFNLRGSSDTVKRTQAYKVDHKNQMDTLYSQMKLIDTLI